MIAYEEFRLRGRIAGFCETPCEWTLRVYEDETLSASIAVASSTCRAETAPLMLFNGQAALSSRSASLVLRFHLVQYEPSAPGSWSVLCKAHLDPVTAVVTGTWVDWMATPAWPRPQGSTERSIHPFQLEPFSTPVTGRVRSLRPLGVGRYEFRGVLVDELNETVDAWVVKLQAQEGGDLVGKSRVEGGETRCLSGSWGQDHCTWVDDQGLSVEAHVDTVLLLGEWSKGVSKDWLELTVISAKRQWRWEDHASTPETFQEAFATCQQLQRQGVDDAVWRRVFSFCDFDWFSECDLWSSQRLIEGK